MGSRGIALLFLCPRHHIRWVVKATPWPFYPRERDPVPIVREAVWAPGSVRTGAEILAPSGIRSPDRPPRSELLYILRCPGPQKARSNGYYAEAGVQNFPKIYEPLQNSNSQKCDVKQVPHWGPTNIRCHRTKFSRPCDLEPGIYARLCRRIIPNARTHAASP